MTRIITITESPSMPGRYTRTVQSGTERPLFSDVRGGDPEAAAASAVSAAIRAGGPYYILAPKKVLDCIPLEIRSRK